MKRRDFLTRIGIVGAAGLMGNQTLQAASGKAEVAKRFGLQVYGLGPELGRDLPAGFKRLKELGYSTLELAGYNNGSVALFHDAIDLVDYQKMAADAGLEVLSSHVRPPIREYTTETFPQLREFWKQTAEGHARAGVKYLIQAAIPTVRSVEEAQRVAQFYTEAAQIAREEGVLWAFHNEVNVCSRVIPGGEESLFLLSGRYPQGARMIYDILLEETDPALVQVELDGMALILGGCDPVTYLKKYPQRITLMHVKDYENLGESGMINQENIFRQFYANGQTDYFVEDENAMSGKQFERIAAAADYLLKATFVK
jgi:sugar phosphate isomerase/epimerase